MIQITPQIAKLVVLRWAKQACSHWEEFSDDANIVSEEDSEILLKAIKDYKEQLDANIKYQESICR